MLDKIKKIFSPPPPAEARGTKHNQKNETRATNSPATGEKSGTPAASPEDIAAKSKADQAKILSGTTFPDADNVRRQKAILPGLQKLGFTPDPKAFKEAMDDPKWHSIIFNSITLMSPQAMDRAHLQLIAHIATPQQLANEILKSLRADGFEPAPQIFQKLMDDPKMEGMIRSGLRGDISIKDLVQKLKDVLPRASVRDNPYDAQFANKTEAEAKAFFRNEGRRIHPDKVTVDPTEEFERDGLQKSRQEATEQFKNLTNAYENFKKIHGYN